SVSVFHFIPGPTTCGRRPASPPEKRSSLFLLAAPTEAASLTRAWGAPLSELGGSSERVWRAARGASEKRRSRTQEGRGPRGERNQSTREGYGTESSHP